MQSLIWTLICHIHPTSIHQRLCPPSWFCPPVIWTLSSVLQAFSHVSRLLSRCQFEALEGLVAKDVSMKMMVWVSQQQHLHPVFLLCPAADREAGAEVRLFAVQLPESSVCRAGGRDVHDAGRRGNLLRRRRWAQSRRHKQNTEESTFIPNRAFYSFIN